MMSKNIIEVKNLIKKYKKFIAVDNISFNVKKGSFFCFLGVNGAGKSTTISMLSTIAKPTSGSIKINGINVIKNKNKIQNMIGVVFQSSVLDKQLTVLDNLKLRASFYGIRKKEFKKQLDKLIKLLDANEIIHRVVGKLSGGQLRKADIMRALIAKPKILFLDEPTTGLDPETRQNLWKTIDQIRKKEKMTVFLTTHYLEETETADDIVIINHGKIIAHGTSNQLKTKYTSDVIKLFFKSKNQILKKLKSMKIEYILFNDHIQINTNNKNNQIKIINAFKNLIDSFELIKGNMDSVFINLTKEGK